MINNNIRLSNLINDETGVITKVLGHGAFRKRITEMGFVRGKKVKVIKNAPLQDPIEYEIMGYNVSLRRSEAQLMLLWLVIRTAVKLHYTTSLRVRMKGLVIMVELLSMPGKQS